MTITAGTRLGRYQIRSKLGEGGMGEVFLAQDTGELDRTVALKFLTPEIASDPKRMQRFIQEARVVSALNHPNILTIYEFGQEADTRFIATEFVDGKTLREHLSGRRVKLHQVLEIAIQVAAALDAAHEAGVVHRDIKPENVMVRRRDEIVKVLDFGLAKASREKPQTDSLRDSEGATQVLVQHTEPGMVMGTVAYMSPEQSRGDAVDARTDIWSLGVVLYEMLAGRVPFVGKDLHRQIIAIQEQDLPPISKLAEGVPERLQEILQKALAKELGERYQTAKDLLIDLRNLRRKLDVETEIERISPAELRGGSSGSDASAAKTTALPSGPGTENRTQPPRVSSAEYVVDGIRKHKAVAGVILLLLAGGLGYWFYGRDSSSPAQIESLAVLPFQNVTRSADVEYLSDGMAEGLINSLSQIPDLTVKARSFVLRYQGKEVDPRRVATELSVQAIVNGRVLQRGNDLVLYLALVDARTGNQLWGKQYDRTLEQLVSLQSEIARDVSEHLRLRLTGTERQQLAKRGTDNAAAYQAYLRGRYYWNKGFSPGFEKSREYFQQAIDLDPTYALAYCGLADYYGFSVASGFLSPSENWPRVESAANQSLALDPTLGESYNSLAGLQLYYHRNWPGAERHFRRGIELVPNFPELRNHYALCLVLFGRNEEALTEIRRAVALEPLSERYSLTLARVLFLMRQYDGAILQLRKTLELNPNLGLAHERLSSAYEKKGMQRDAIAHLVKALTLSRESEQAATLERTYTTSGFGAAHRALAELKLQQLDEKASRGEYVPAMHYVTAHMRAGDENQAFAALAKATEERNRLALEFKVSPLFDSLRADPRFAELAGRVNP